MKKRWGTIESGNLGEGVRFFWLPRIGGAVTPHGKDGVGDLKIRRTEGKTAPGESPQLIHPSQKNDYPVLIQKRSARRTRYGPYCLLERKGKTIERRKMENLITQLRSLTGEVVFKKMAHWGGRAMIAEKKTEKKNEAGSERDPDPERNKHSEHLVGRSKKGARTTA